MKDLIRRAILSVALLAGITTACAQAPPPVPALPDTERRTTYSITASTCACNVGFQLFGDSTDVVNWMEVFVNGVLIPQSGGWTITSPTGPIATIPRPITDAVLTFTTAQTGTVQIVGARRPRRTTQFQESQPVPTRNFNQTFSDITATLRELWDKSNDFTGRSVRTPPGETLALLPVLASRQNMGACFDSSGNLTSCVAAPSSGSFAAGSGILFTGTNPTTISFAPSSCTVFTSSVPGCVPASGGAATNFLAADGTFKPVAAGSAFGGYFDAVKTYGADPTGVANSQTAINNAVAAACAPGVRGIVWIQPGTYLVNGGINATNISAGCKIQGGGLTATVIKATTSTNALLDMTGSSAVEVNGIQFDSNTATVTNYGILLSTSGTPSSPCNVNHFRAISVTGKWIKAGIYIFDCSDSSFENSQVSNFTPTASACVYISNTNDLTAISNFTTIFAGTGQSGDWRFSSFEIHDLSQVSGTSTVIPLFISGVSSPIKFIGGVIAGSVAAATGGNVTFGGVPTTSVSFIGSQFYGDNATPSKFAFWTFNTMTGLVVQGSSIQYGTSFLSQPTGAIWTAMNITGNTIGGGSFVTPAAGGLATITRSIFDAANLAINLGAAGVLTHNVMLQPGAITAGTQTANGSF